MVWISDCFDALPRYCVHVGSVAKPGEFENAEMVTKNHEPNCQCEICLYGMEAFRAKEKRLMETVGWIVHYVQGNHYCNYHTHGVLEKFQQTDFQITLEIPPDLAHGLFHRVMDRVKEGERFQAGEYVKGIVNDEMLVLLKLAYEGDRDVLRIIIPDPNGHLTPKKMQRDYARQHRGTK